MLESFCSPSGRLEKIITNGFLLFLTWAVPWSILEEECMPGSNLFGIIILTDCCVLAGQAITLVKLPKLPPLPPLLGMLLMGILLVNIPHLNVASSIDNEWSATLRSIALTAILVKAGLELDGAALKTLKAVCLRLTALPCIIEAVTCMITCRFLLGFPWQWGILLGFVLGAVTPAVIVPSLLSLQENGFGVQKGIPTLVIAASSFDDVLAISGFSVVLGITFSGVTEESLQNNSTSNFTTNNLTLMDTDGQSAGTLAWMILRGPVEMVTGIVFGGVLGLLLWYIPIDNKKSTIQERSIFVFGFGIFSIFASRVIRFPGAGALAAIVAPFVAALKWKDKTEVSKNISKIWTFFEPIMFGLIGAEIEFRKLAPGTIASGLAVIFIGLTTRFIASYCAVSCSEFTPKEKLFISIAWIPKATVQAAIGPMALDTARKAGASIEIETMGKQVLTIAVLSILITAPLGAAAIGLTGPKLLSKSEEAEIINPNIEVTLSTTQAGEPTQDNEKEPLTQDKKDENRI